MKKILILIFFILSFFNLQAQMKGLGGLQELELMQQELDNQMQPDMMSQGEQIPVGNPIDPDFYFPGAGDILSFQSLPIINKEKFLTISPEKTIFLPRIGEIKIKGMTLTQVKDTLSKIFAERNPNAITSVSLKRARNCLVKISGNVMFPSTYALPSTYKVSTAITAANFKSASQIPIPQYTSMMMLQDKMRESEKLFSESGIPSLRTYFSRNIKVNHLDGTTSLVDIELARILNDESLDPYINESDEIIVPFEQSHFSKIIISGEVTRPVVLPYKSGDKASYLLKFGYGFSDNANLDDIYLYLSGKDKLKLNVDKDMNLLSKDINLEAGAMIIVGKTQPDISSEKTGVISIKGEVNKPGVYPIVIGETSLKDIIQSAGGITEDAYLPLAKVIRRSDFQQSIIDPKKELNEKFKQSTLVLEDSTRFIYDILYKEQNLSVDFQAIMNDQERITLSDGDIIIIPENPKRVYVFGQVVNPGFVEFVKGKTMTWYIERAGGFAEGADEERASIIRAANNTWINGYNEETYVFAGDEIYVPNPPSYPPSVEQQKYSLYISLIGAFVGVVGLAFSMYTTYLNSKK